MKAEEFIDHDEILETLSYADEHKTDRELITSILNKAKQMKGLSHREASVLLACEDEDRINFLKFIREHLNENGKAFVIVMGDGKETGNNKFIKSCFR